MWAPKPRPPVTAPFNPHGRSGYTLSGQECDIEADGVSSTLRDFGFRPRQGSHSISRWLSEAPPPETRNDLTHSLNHQKRLIPSRSKYSMSVSEFGV